MKRYLLFLSFAMFQNFLVFSQGSIDALRYSQTFSGGTARSVGMGGAFGALGGDFSSIGINPAGLGVYSASEFTITPEINYKNTTSRYIGVETEEPLTSFNFNNLGFVGHIKLKESGLKSINLSIGYTKLNTFDRSIHINGINTISTYADAMAISANDFGITNVDDLDEYSERLFYEGWLIDQDSLGFYTTDFFFDEDDNFLPSEQDVTIKETGKMNEWNISGSFNYNDVLYFGASFNFIPVRYEATSSFKEYDANEPSFLLFDYNQSIKVSGTGYSGKFGVIVRPVPILRLGASVHLPTSFSLKQESNAYLVSNHPEAGGKTYYPYGSTDEVVAESKYKVISPLKSVGSIGLTLGKIAVISTDVEFLNYSAMTITDHSNSNYPEGEVNDEIKAVYTNSLNVKAGAEFRLGLFRLRGGFGYYESPYNKSNMNAEAYNLSYSAGFGIREKSFFFDLAWMLNYNDEQFYLYEFGDYENTKTNIDTKTTRILATVGFRF